MWWHVVLLKSFFSPLFLPYDKYVQKVNCCCSLSLAKGQRVVAQSYLLDSTLLNGLVMQPPGCAECRVLCRGVLSTCVCVSCLPLGISCLLLWLLGYSTQQRLHTGTFTRFTTGKSNNSLWQQISEMWGQLWYLFVWLNSEAIWSCHCQVGWALARKVYYRLWLRQEVSLVGTRLLKPVLTISLLDARQKSRWNWEARSIPCSTFWSEIQKLQSSGNTAAELKSPDCCACVHNDYDRCIFSFKLAFYLWIFFPVKQRSVFCPRSILLRH